MENMMPQLNLPDKTIQQQPRSLKSSGRSDKTGREDDFRDLLENSSKRNAPAEKEPARSDPLEKADGQQPLKKQDSAAEKPDAAGKKEDMTDEEILIDVGMQAFQLLMMGSSHLEDAQPENAVQIQPETAEGPTVSPLQGLTEDLGGQDGQIPAAGQMLAEGPAGREESKDLGTVGIPAAGEKIPAVQERAGEIPAGQEPKTDGRVRRERPAEGKAGTEPEIRTTHRDVVRQARAAGSEGQTRSDGQAGEGADQSGRFGAQIYAAQAVLHQDHVQGQEAVPTIHVQTARPQELMDQLMDQLKGKISLRDQAFEIQLQPENLGRLAIKVAYTAEKVSISIVCSNERTMELLSSGAKNIAQIMEENLGTPTTVMVDQNESDYLEQYNDQEDPRRQQDQERPKQKDDKDEHQDFLQQLRLGLI